MTSVEALGWWLADRSQTEAREPFIETRMPLDRETGERLLYLSKWFAIPKTALLRELVRAAVKDVFAVIPSDPLPASSSPTCAVLAWILRGSGGSIWRASKTTKKGRNSRP